MNASGMIGLPGTCPPSLSLSRGGRAGEDTGSLVAHTLFYFTKPGDLVLDPTAGGALVSDVCLVFKRKCQSLDLR